MLRIGVTGPMASGKSTVARRFEEHGAIRLDADTLGWEVLRDPDVRRAIATAFGPEVLDATGEIDRRRLGPIVFADPAALKRLDAIVQPTLRERVLERLDAASGAAVIVLDAALLSTWQIERSLDGIVEVVAADAHRIERLKASRGYSDEEAGTRIGGQRLPPLKQPAHHWRIDNDGDEAALRSSADRVWREITLLKPAPRP